MNLMFLLFGLFTLLLLGTISWVMTCGVVRVVTFCFGLGFDLAVASGVWVIVVALWFVSGCLRRI